ncbi:hypothetical protein ACHQM5_017160 [Ranunculus cassubicifolius]
MAPSNPTSSPQTYPYPVTINVSNFVTKKLAQSNYLMWKTQFLGLVESQEMLGFLDATIPVPKKGITVEDKETHEKHEVLNPDYAAWKRSDRLLRGWMTGQLEDEPLSLVVGLDTASAVWSELEASYAQDSQEREFFLQQQLQSHRKGTSSLSDYIKIFKGYCDDLAAIGKPVSDRDKVFALLRGLGRGYESFITTMLKPPTPSYRDIVPMLQSHETMRLMNDHEDNVTNHNMAFVSQYSNGQGRGRKSRRGKQGYFNSKGRGFTQTSRHVSNQYGPMQTVPNVSADKAKVSLNGPHHDKEKGADCQICGKPNHSALRCFNRFNHAYQADDIPQALAAMKLSDSESSAWFPDTGASAHMTSNSGNLRTLAPYFGSEKIIVGNGDALDITHVGTASIRANDQSLHLKNVLVVPEIKKNLLSVSQMTSDFPYTFEFSRDGFVIKNRRTGAVITSGQRHGDLYALHPQEKHALFSTRFQVVSDDIWHQRLGHPQMAVIHFLKKNKLIISNSSNKTMLCSSCQMAKSCRLPFLSSDNICHEPFGKIHCDLWGPAPVSSVQRFRYYVIFVDDCTRYTWYFPLKHKSEFFQCFIDFLKYVQTQFDKKMRIFQSDGGGEFTGTQFLSYLRDHGILHQLSCPHTSEQNGRVERKHRNVTELGLSMMFNGYVPRRFWVEAFSSAVWLINRLPSRVLDMNSPYEKLYGRVPNYASLRVFGCRCFPYLRDYAKNKFDPRSLPCVFLGYSDQYKGYRCLHPSTGRVYTSRHVVFDESMFPFQNPGLLFSASSSDTLTTFDDWISGASDEQESNESGPPQERQHLDSHIHVSPSSADLQLRSNVPHETPTPVFTPTAEPSNMDVESAPAVEVTNPPAQTSSPLINNSPTHIPQIQLNETLTDPQVTPLSNQPPHIVPMELSMNPPSSQSISHTEPTQHYMTTRLQDGVVKPNPKYLYTANVIPTEPKSVKAALKHPGWYKAMQEELAALHENETWELVPRRPDMNIVGCKWVFKAKLQGNGSLERLKARLVAKGFNQMPGIDFQETFSPVIKPATIRTVLTVALSRNWDIRQMDVRNAFLHGFITEPVFMQQPPGFQDATKPDYVCRLKRALYGLRQAPRAWFDRFSTFLLSMGFLCSTADPSLFVCHSKQGTLLLLLYVDDIILTGDNEKLLKRFTDRLGLEFSMKDMGFLHYFLGVHVHKFQHGLFLNQAKYTVELLERAQMKGCKPSKTPMASKLRPPLNGDNPFADPQLYRSIVGGLQYLTFTRPDISYSVNYVCQFMHQPTQFHFQLVKRILRYLQGTIDYGTRLLSDCPLNLYAFSDSDWAGCPTTRRSTTGFCVYLGGNCLSWSAKKQHTVARSSTEAEYRALASTTAEVTWISFILRDIGLYIPETPTIFCDNPSALQLTVNPVFHARTKHIEIDYHFVREKVALGSLVTRYVPTGNQVADVFTKPLSHSQFCTLRTKLGLWPLPQTSLRGHIEISEIDLVSSKKEERSR